MIDIYVDSITNVLGLIRTECHFSPIWFGVRLTLWQVMKTLLYPDDYNVKEGIK